MRQETVLNLTVRMQPPADPDTAYKQSRNQDQSKQRAPPPRWRRGLPWTTAHLRIRIGHKASVDSSAPAASLQPMRLLTAILLAMMLFWPAAHAADASFVTSDGVRLHYSDTDPSARLAHTLVFIPGWTMPGWIFTPQIEAFRGRDRVVVLDPRGQGDSEIPAAGYNQDRRGDDIAELIGRLHARRVVLIGWSLGVLDTLAYVHRHGDGAFAGLVLIDNSVGENPPPAPPRLPSHKGPRQSHAAFMAAFVRSMFRKPQPVDYLRRLTAASLRTPEFAANELLAYPVPRSYWREAVYATDKPILYVVRPALAGQAGNLAAHHPNTDTVVIPNIGHALFVDDPTRFDTLLQGFLARRIQARGAAH